MKTKDLILVIGFLLVAILILSNLDDSKGDGVDKSKFKDVYDQSVSNLNKITDIDQGKKLNHKDASGLNSIKPENENERVLLILSKASLEFQSSAIKIYEKFSNNIKSIDIENMITPENLTNKNKINSLMSDMQFLKTEFNKYNKELINEFNKMEIKIKSDLNNEYYRNKVNQRLDESYRDLITLSEYRLDYYEKIEDILNFSKNSVSNGTFKLNDGYIDISSADVNDSFNKLIIAHDDALALVNDAIIKNEEKKRKRLQNAKNYLDD